ncbi:MAG: flagellar biosynthetic protein FliO [Proteobacteria bacterium]|nr:flagellar biosynthetic protein FliO [Pseudomonadota bacterium]
MAPTGLSLLWFIAVLALIPLALWLLKRSPYGATLGAATGVTRVIATMPLSPGQRIVTVEIGSGEARQWLVLGVTQQHITPLHTLAPQEFPAAPTLHPDVPFASLLHRLRHKRSGDGMES